MIGSVLPWITLSAPLSGTVSRSGISGGEATDGYITLIGGGALIATAIVLTVARLPFVIPLIAAVGLGWVVWMEWSEIADIIRGAEAETGYIVGTHGIGLVLVAVGVALALGGSVAASTVEP